jgi:hypothetical protein
MCGRTVPAPAPEAGDVQARKRRVFTALPLLLLLLLSLLPLLASGLEVQLQSGHLWHARGSMIQHLLQCSQVLLLSPAAGVCEAGAGGEPPARWQLGDHDAICVLQAHCLRRQAADLQHGVPSAQALPWTVHVAMQHVPGACAQCKHDTHRSASLAACQRDRALARASKSPEYGPQQTAMQLQ